MDSTTHPYVIDADAEGSSKETAVLLIGTAQEAGLNPSTDVQKITRPYPGFRITEALAAALGGSLDDPDPDTSPGPDTDPTGTVAEDIEEFVKPEPDLSGNKQSLAPEHDIHGAPTAVAYQDWDYQDLKAAVKTRGIEVTDQRSETLVAALVADDEALAADSESLSDDEPATDETA